MQSLQKKDCKDTWEKLTFNSIHDIKVHKTVQLILFGTEKTKYISTHTVDIEHISTRKKTNYRKDYDSSLLPTKSYTFKLILPLKSIIMVI